MSNTPLREVIEAHKNYWEYKIRSENLNLNDFILSGGKAGSKIPDLEVFIVNVIPEKVENVLTDYDVAKSRLDDIHLLDKSDYDIQVANTFSQHVDLILKLIALVEDHDPKLKDKIANVLNSPVTESGNNSTAFPPSLKSSETNKKYIDTIKTAFKLSKVIRIERAADSDTIWGKFSDFSEETISKLIEEGKRDAELSLEKYSKIN